MKLSESLTRDNAATLEKMRNEKLPAIFLFRRPSGRRFQQIRLSNRRMTLQGMKDDQWTAKKGLLFEVRIREKTTFLAKLSSITFKKIRELTIQDALAEGYKGEGPLIRLRESLLKRYGGDRRWEGEETALDIMTFERVG